MSLFGKIFIFLIALGAVAATVLTAKTYDVRNSWMKKIAQLKDDVEKQKPIIAEKEKQLEALKAERDALFIGWGEPFQNVQGQLDNNFGLTSNDVGLVNWLASLDQAQQAAQVVYVFQPQPDGSSVYVGSFQLAGAVAPGGTARFTPTWTVRNEDFEDIPNANGPFRVRPLVPAHFPTEYAETRKETTIMERALADKQIDLAQQKQRQIDAQAILDKRTAELVGPDGLVPQIQSAEDARNVELEELDYWRRQVDQARKKIEKLTEENAELEKQLEPADPESEPVTAQVARQAL